MADWRWYKNETRYVLLLIAHQAHGLVGPFFARRPLLINRWYGVEFVGFVGVLPEGEIPKPVGLLSV